MVFDAVEEAVHLIQQLRWNGQAARPALRDEVKSVRQLLSELRLAGGMGPGRNGKLDGSRHGPVVNPGAGPARIRAHLPL